MCKNQKIVNCSEAETCWKVHLETERGFEAELRGCVLKQACEFNKKKCESGDIADFNVSLMDEKITKCAVAFCVSEGDTSCSGAFTVSANLIMLMFAFVVYSLIFF